MKRGRWILVLALAPALMATSCIYGIPVHVHPQPYVVEPVAFTMYQYSDTAGTVGAFEVRECADSTSVLWRLSREPRADTATLRMTYGRAPEGFREAAPARPLEPGGCYHAVATSADPRERGGTEVFRLLPNGAVIVGLPQGRFGDAPEVREMNRASVACVRGYRRAAGAADSARVDAWEHNVHGAALTCGWIRTHWPDALQTTVTRGENVRDLVASAALTVGIFVLDHHVN